MGKTADFIAPGLIPAQHAAKRLWNNFEAGTKSIGTWFGIDKDRSGHLLHNLYGSTDPIREKAKKATDGLLNASNALYATGRQRARASSLATGASAAGTANLTSGMAYGKPTLGG